MSESDSRESFDRLSSGDEKAFDDLYRTFHPLLCAFATTIVRNGAAAEDIVQDVFVTIWTNRKKLVTPTTPRALAASTAAFAAADWAIAGTGPNVKSAAVAGTINM